MIYATRSGDLTGAARVDFATADGSAIDGQDYVATIGTLRWADGAGGRRSLRVPLINDALGEPEETVQLVLSNPRGVSLSTPATATLHIVDDDPVSVAFATAQQMVSEGTGGAGVVAAIDVRLSGPSLRRISVPFTYALGTASSDDIRSVSASPLVFRPGQTVRRITVVTMPDSLPEARETIDFQLGAPVNAVLGAQSGLILRIRDDD